MLSKHMLGDEEIVCQLMDKIQVDLLVNTLLPYAKKDYPKFWRAIESLKVFLEVKDKFCPIRKTKK